MLSKEVERLEVKATELEHLAGNLLATLRIERNRENMLFLEGEARRQAMAMLFAEVDRQAARYEQIVGRGD